MNDVAPPQGLPVPDLGFRDPEDVVARIVEALSEAHDDLAAAQAISRQDGQGVYAQIWRSLCVALSSKLSDRYDVQLIKPGRAAYKVPVIGDVLLYPWRPAGGGEPSEVLFGTSFTRERLWSLPVIQEVLDFGTGDVEAEDDSLAPSSSDDNADATAVFFEAARLHLQVVVIAMTSDARRLRTIEWGEAALETDGALTWVSHQVLFDSDSGSKPASTTPQTFSEGTPPSPGVRLKPNTEKSESDE
jgi:hypothetical protein